jgi:hypothetical protein
MYKGVLTYAVNSNNTKKINLMVFTDQNSLQLKIHIVTFNPFFGGKGM